MQALISWSYKYLPMIFGCHCIPERCFSYRGRRFPICARCTGEGIGLLAALLTIGFWHPRVSILFLLLLPCLIDAIVQRLTSYESNNIRRVITGFFFGYAAIELFLLSIAATFMYGYQLGMRYFGQG